MTDTISRDKCPRCGAKGKYDSENRVHYYDCSTWWWDDDGAPDETVGMSCITRQRDTLKSKMAQAVEALEQIVKCDIGPGGWGGPKALKIASDALYTLKDNPQPINKDNP